MRARYRSASACTRWTASATSAGSSSVKLWLIPVAMRDASAVGR